MKKAITITSLLAAVTLTSCNEKVAEVQESIKTTESAIVEKKEELTNKVEVVSDIIASGGADISSGVTSEITNMAQEIESALIPGESVTKEVSYASPAGTDSMKVTLVTSGDLIKSVEIVPMPTHEFSKNHQENFAKAIGAEVIGKKKSELNLSAVAGASLTTDAFMKFVKAN